MVQEYQTNSNQNSDEDKKIQLEALKTIADWSKWLVTIQTGLIAYFVSFEHVKFALPRLAILSIFVFSIFFGVELLGRIPKAMQSIPIKKKNPNGSEELDVHSWIFKRRLIPIDWVVKIIRFTRINNITPNKIKDRLSKIELFKEELELRKIAGFQHNSFILGLVLLIVTLLFGL